MLPPKTFFHNLTLNLVVVILEYGHDVEHGCLSTGNEKLHTPLAKHITC